MIILLWHTVRNQCVTSEKKTSVSWTFLSQKFRGFKPCSYLQERLTQWCVTMIIEIWCQIKAQTLFLSPLIIKEMKMCKKKIDTFNIGYHKFWFSKNLEKVGFADLQPFRFWRKISVFFYYLRFSALVHYFPKKLDYWQMYMYMPSCSRHSFPTLKTNTRHLFLASYGAECSRHSFPTLKTNTRHLFLASYGAECYRHSFPTLKRNTRHLFLASYGAECSRHSFPTLKRNTRHLFLTSYGANVPAIHFRR